MDATRLESSAPGRTRLLPAALAGFVGALLLAALVLAGVVPALAGARTVAIRTDEGPGALAAGALAVLRPGTPQPGDVVALATNPGEPSTLRRVLAVTEDVVALSSEGSDQLRVDLERVDGISLYAVPWAGALWTAVATPAGMLFVAAGLLLLVAAHEIRSQQRQRREHQTAG